MRVHARTCGGSLDGRVQGVAVGGIGNGRKEGGRLSCFPRDESRDSGLGFAAGVGTADCISSTRLRPLVCVGPCVVLSREPLGGGCCGGRAGGHCFSSDRRAHTTVRAGVGYAFDGGASTFLAVFSLILLLV